uniref:Transmembrane protein n=1 Tax=Triticum urartu TaxID=4572 RepID=A0A8R7V8L0_TRIUA
MCETKERAQRILDGGGLGVLCVLAGWWWFSIAGWLVLACLRVCLGCQCRVGRVGYLGLWKASRKRQH